MKGCALVIGCAGHVMRDLAIARELGDYAKTYCVKYAGVHWPGDNFVWCTLHPEFMDKYEGERRLLGLSSKYEIVAPLEGELGSHAKKGRIKRRVSYRWPGMNASASSGIYGAKVAIDDGFQRVVLVGVPLTEDGGHFVRKKPWAFRDSFMAGFKLALPHIKGKVRSVSGYTKEVLGEPTPEWIAGGC